jgi:ParB family transcriptional regulator, chromosome partitioning protein
MSIKSNAVGRSDIFKLPFESITVQDGYNDRTKFTEKESFKELKESIRIHGIRKPLTVKAVGDEIFLREGHRRYEAAMQLFAESIQFPNCDYVLCLPFKGTEEEEVLDVIISNDGEPLTSLEQGYTMLKLETKFGYDAKTIAEKTSKSLPHVYNCLKLAKSPESVRNYLEDGKVTANVVLDAIAKHKKNEEALEKAIHDAVNNAEGEGKGKAKMPSKGTKKATANIRNIITERIEFLQKCDATDTLPVADVIALLTKIRDYNKQEKKTEKKNEELTEA